jgi:ergothioneine biosynthesis protein EgtB
MAHDVGADLLIARLEDARTRTLDLVRDLSDEALFGPRLAIVNPLHWEIGHVAWFQELWNLRHARGEDPIREDGDRLWDSSAIPHDDRWDLPLPSRRETLDYLRATLDRLIERLSASEPSEEERYFAHLAIFHEDMHDEAFTYTRQTLGHSAPVFTAPRGELLPSRVGPKIEGDAAIPGGTFRLGSERGSESFVFDNEKWAHPKALQAFRISRAAVTQGEMIRFVEAGGYEDDALWSAPGRRWKRSAGARQPLYWKKERGRWLRRTFDRWIEVEPDHPAIHVAWYEAEAYCRWAQRRLPTELEWEVAAAGEPDPSDPARLAPTRRRYPWGDDPPTPVRANLDGTRMDTAAVSAFPEGDSAFGVRQMIGNVWEWTADDFLPYPEFSADPYRDYSQPWFGDHKVLRGGCWVTRARLIRSAYRNFYKPDRRDVWAGFRTCAL